jgi:hypothetical protein
MKARTVIFFSAVALASARPSPPLPPPYSAPDLKSAQLEPDLPPTGPGLKDGATITKVRYGPYKVPALGMIESKFQFMIEKPCSECYVTAMQADMEYADGRTANTEEGAWLHHIVLYNGIGWFGGKKDLVCANPSPNGIVMSPHRIFASGNERVAVRLNGKYKYGHAIDTGDYLHILYDIANQSTQPQEYYIVMVSSSSIRNFIRVPTDQLHRSGNGFQKLHRATKKHA